MKRLIFSAAVLCVAACWCLLLVPTVDAFHHGTPPAAAFFRTPHFQLNVNAFGFNSYSPGNAALAAALNYQAINRAQAIANAQAAAQYRYQASLQAAFRARPAYPLTVAPGLAPSYTSGSFSPLYASVPRQPFVSLNVPAYGNCGAASVPGGGYGGCPPGASSMFAGY